MVNYKFGKYEERKLVTPGVYKAEIIEIKSGTTKTKGDPRRQVIFKLDEGEKISDFLIEIKSCHWKIQRLFKACDLPFEGDVTVGDNWEELLGQKIRVNVIQEEYNGEMRNRINAYFPLAGVKNK